MSSLDLVLFWTFRQRNRQFFFQSEAEKILDDFWKVLPRLGLGMLGNFRPLLLACRKLLVYCRCAMILDETWKVSHAFIISFYGRQFMQVKRRIHIPLAYWTKERATRVNLSKEGGQQIVAGIFALIFATNEKCKLNIDTAKRIWLLKVPNQNFHDGSQHSSQLP